MKPKFSEKYKRLEKIGIGKMGTVYRIEKIQNELGSSSPQYFASKHISLSTISIPEARNELKFLEKLKHMYIVRYYEDFVENDELIVVMDLCEGKDLEYHIKQMKKEGKYFNENVISTWIFQLILVLEYIHSCNIIHRDIKPQNIFVDSDMNLKIGDFGVSKLLEGTENCKTLAGTPIYFSPELINGENYSNKTDVWSLGCVIYEICSLERPFKPDGGGMLNLYQAIQTKQAKSIPSLYSKDINKLIQKMLVKDHKKRPTSRALLQDPILVQLMINYSSQVNLKEEVENKGLVQHKLSESFIGQQVDLVNEKLDKFQEEIREKMESLKKMNSSNKNTKNERNKTTEIDQYYVDVQKKMAKLKDVVDSAFRELKKKSEEDQNIEKNGNGRGNENKSQISNSSLKNKSNLSDSDVTIQSINLGESQKGSKQKDLQNEILSFNESKTISSVNSVLLASKKPSSSPLNLDTTYKSEYLSSISPSVPHDSTENPVNLQLQTIQHIDDIAHMIESNPQLILDESYLSMTLSMSKGTTERGKKRAEGKCHEESGNSLNFDFSKKSFDESFGLSMKNQHKVPEKIETSESLEDEYEEDFESYEEDKEMDIREQEKKSVRELFSSTLKNFSINESKINSSIMKNKFGLSTIQERSSEGGSTISENLDI